MPIVGSGPVVPPDQFSLALNIDIAGTKTPVTLVQTGGHLYAIALGKTILLPVAHATANLRAVIAGLIRTMRAPSLGSTKTIAGIPAQELSGQLDGAAASQLVAPVLGLVPGASGAGSTRAQQLARQQALAAALGQGTLTEWVRVSDLRPAELEVVASIANGAAVSPALEHASFDVTLELSDYNVPETIAIPAGAQPMSAAQLQQLIGAAPGGRAARASSAATSATLRTSKSSLPYGASANAVTISAATGLEVRRIDSASTLAWL